MDYDDLTYEQIRARADELGPSAQRDYSITVLRNITVEPLDAYLRYLCGTLGLNARLHFGGYDVLLGATAEGDQTRIDDADAVIVFLKLEHCSPRLAYEHAAMDDSETAEEVARINDYVEQVISGIRQRTDALIAWLGFEMPTNTAVGVLDGHLEHGQASEVGRLNESIRCTLRSHRDAYFLDTNRMTAKLGLERYYDLRYWFAAGSPYTREALKLMAGDLFRLIRASLGAGKKCLVLDCDNVLWGGVIGEDGINGIQLGAAFPGSMYQVFQRRVYELGKRGVILALNSKNNEQDVWEVFDSHPDMVLSRDDIAASRINWRDKATNLVELAAELNIGLDSMVFVDDSPVEVELVRQTLPEVQCLALPAGEPVKFVQELLSPGWFDLLSTSSEDRKRGEMYQAERRRRELRTRAVDLDSYFRSLEMCVLVEPANAYSVPRVAQLTQKTNQFNLTTRRYTEAEIQSFLDTDGVDVLTLRLTDKFGDYGLVGVAIMRTDGEDRVIDSFLMSCRALNRGAETVLLDAAVQAAFRSGASGVTGTYIRTAKNALAEKFYADHGFAEVSHGEDGVVYRLDPNARHIDVPAYFKDLRVET